MDIPAPELETMLSSSKRSTDLQIDQTRPAEMHMANNIKREMDSDDKNDPMRTEDRAGSETEYSVDLNALETRSRSSSPLAARHVTNLMSEDIEGPSDFTENIGHWLHRTSDAKHQSQGTADFTKGASSSPGRPLSSTPKAMKGLIERKDHLQPSVEDYNSPFPSRLSLLVPEDDDKLDDTQPPVSASQGNAQTHVPESSSHPSDVEEQILTLQARCEELQRRNEEFDKALKMQQAARQKDAVSQDAAKSTAKVQDEKIRELERQLNDEKQAHKSLDAAGKAKEAALADELEIQRQRFEDMEAALSDQKQLLQNVSKQAERKDNANREAQEKLAQQGLKWKQRALEHSQTAQVRNGQEVQRESVGRDSRTHDTQVSVQETERWKQLSLAARAEIEELKSQKAAQASEHEMQIKALREEYDGVAKDNDNWVVAKVEEKENQHAALQARLEKKIARQNARILEMEQLHAVYGKELMLAWGREEFGRAPPGEKQKYEYRHT